MNQTLGMPPAPIAVATWIILIATALASLAAFQNPSLKERWMFNPKAILADRQWERMLTSGLIHADWVHFIFNAFSFYGFARFLEMIYGWKTLVLIYCASIIGGSLLSLFLHRHHEYRALGASGGVCGVIFAAIFLLPGTSISFFFIPIGIPALAYAVIFLVVSFLGHRRQTGNIGHDAHLGGAMIGLLTATALYPQLILAAPITFAVVLTVSLIVLLLLIFDPLHLAFQFGKRDADPGDRSRFYAENRARNEKMAELDGLLDLVARNGIESLSAAKRKKLEQLSKELYGEGQR
ncbi:MAG TPA: rhomboid family intramembrane serine protease [Verrucomicrobiae bacterium]